MSRRATVALALVALIATAVGVWYFLLRAPEQAEDTSDATPKLDRAALVAKKRAARGDVTVDRRPCALAGQVREPGGGAAIPGAIVYVKPKERREGDDDRPRFARADGDGGWRIEGLPAGELEVTAAADGFLPSGDKELTCGPGVNKRDVTIELTRGGLVLTGAVADYGGGPIEEVLIRATGGGRAARRLMRGRTPVAVTDENGQYRITLPEGRYRLETWHDDYVTENASVHVRGEAPTHNFKLMPGGVLEGIVVARATGEPVAEAIVKTKVLRGRDSSPFANFGRSVSETTTDNAGRFRLRGLGTGVVSIEARAKGLSTAAPVEVPLAIGEQQSGVTVPLDEALDISGFVVDKADPERGVADVHVSMGSFSGGMSGYAAKDPTDKDGYFELHGVPPATYMFRLDGEGIIPDMFGTRREFKESADDVLIEVSFGAELAGRVDPAKPARISLEMPDDEPQGFGSFSKMMKASSARGDADDDGEFSVEAAPVGAWKIVANADDGSRGETTVDLPEKGLTGVVIELEERAHVSGTLLDKAGEPLAQARVVLERDKTDDEEKMRRRWGSDGNDTTDTAGGFEFSAVEPGSYHVYVTGPGGEALEPLAGGDTDEESQRVGVPLTIDGSNSVESLVIEVDYVRAVITGVVRDESGAPAPDVWVSAEYKPGEDEAEPDRFARFFTGGTTRALTDGDGRFELEDLQEGTYALEAQASAGGSRGSLSDVKTGDDVVLELEGLGTITGVVTAGGEPATRYQLDLQKKDRDAWAGWFSGRRKIAAEDGRFELPRLDPGAYVLVATAESGAESAEVEVVSGETVEVAIQLAGWGGVKGVVQDPDGSPLPGLTVMAMSSGGSAKGGEEFFDLLSGAGGIKTDKSGAFAVDGLGPGNVDIVIMSGGMMSAPNPIAGSKIKLEAGETRDLGTLVGLPGDLLPEKERGDLGLSVDAGYKPPVKDRDKDKAKAEGQPEVEDGPLRLWVQNVTKGGPAEGAGVLFADEVVAIDGQAVTELGPTTAAIRVSESRVRKGQTVTLELRSAGEDATHTASVTAR